MVIFDMKKHYEIIKAAVKLGMRNNPSKGPKYQVGRFLKSHGIIHNNEVEQAMNVAEFQLMQEIINKQTGKIPSLIYDNGIALKYGKDSRIENKNTVDKK